MLEAHQLTKRFTNRTAVNPLDLRIAPGEIFARLGPNGAGKTTINCLARTGTSLAGMLALAGLLSLWAWQRVRPARVGILTE